MRRKAPTRPDGWIYVLTHPAWASIGMVKIGMTSRDPTKRGAQITNHSGLIAPSRVHCCVWVPDRRSAERIIHRRLQRFRVRRARELFRVSPDFAATVLRELQDASQWSVTCASRRRVAPPPSWPPAIFLAVMAVLVWLVG